MKLWKCFSFAYLNRKWTHFPALQAEEENEEDPYIQLKRAKKSKLVEKAKKSKKPRLKKGEEQVSVVNNVMKDKPSEKREVNAQASTSRYGRVLKTPKKFLEEEQRDKIQIKLGEVGVKDVKIQAAKLPRDELERLLAQKEAVVEKEESFKGGFEEILELELGTGKEAVENKLVDVITNHESIKVKKAANLLMRDLDEFMDSLDFEDHVNVGEELLKSNDQETGLNIDHLEEKGFAVQDLIDSWDDWESKAEVENVGPWRASESESFVGESIEVPEVVLVLIEGVEEEGKTDQVMSHDGDDSEMLTSESDASPWLGCMELTLFGDS